MSTDRPRVRVQNRADGGLLFWLAKLYAFGILAVLGLLVVTGLGVFAAFARSAPAVPDLRRYAETAPGVTRFLAGDGTLLGELASERREILPYDRFPPKLIEAFLAAEDHEFFDHGGLYLRGIVRAAWANFSSGEFAQGGSTITQQVAKQFLGSQKTLSRKVTEAILARRLEARYSKKDILGVYLNHIFLGAGAYGVQAAAQRYFSRDVWDLAVDEMALLAALAQAPSRDSPLSNPENARRRRDSVLDKMARYGNLTEDEAFALKAKPIALRPRKDVFGDRSPYFSEHVRREVERKYGKDGLLSRGLTVETTILPWVDGVAYENVDFGARKQDKRQGWRGPEAHLMGESAAVFVARQRERYGDGALTQGRRYLALVESVEGSGAKVRIGERLLDLPLRNMSWAARWSMRDFTNDHKIDSATQALRTGDVVWVAPVRTQIRKFSDWSYDEKLNPHWLREGERDARDDEVTLEQTPRVQASILTFDHETGYILAMVGGQDHARSQFNRTIQACRQPGSTYKPIYYSLALEQGFGFDTELNDIPRAEVDPVTGEVWVPVNLHGTIDNKVSLEYALVFSKNVPSVDLFNRVGAQNAEAWARRLGFTTPIIADKALALGASCVTVDELGRAFAIFARNGRWLDLVSVKRVIDRDGQILEDHSVMEDPFVPPAGRLHRLVETAGARAREAISARTAYLTTRLLRGVVSDGYSSVLRATEIPAAGKTGTSSATMDLWFVAFTSRWLTTTWFGDDLRERPLGRDDAAYMSAVPLWARYMAEATMGLDQDELPGAPPAGVRPGDRGGNRGPQMGRMPLVPHRRERLPQL